MTVETLNDLERAVLAATSTFEFADADALRSQIDGIRVENRRNTGHGFYTDLTTIENRRRIKSWRICPEGVSAKIEGFIGPMVFVLFVNEDGLVHLFEGAATADDTMNVDFSNVRFEII